MASFEDFDNRANGDGDSGGGCVGSDGDDDNKRQIVEWQTRKRMQPDVKKKKPKKNQEMRKCINEENICLFYLFIYFFISLFPKFYLFGFLFLIFSDLHLSRSSTHRYL